MSNIDRISVREWLVFRTEAMAHNVSNIPTGRTYAGFVLVWTTVPFFVASFCIAAFTDGHSVAGLLLILLTVFGFVRHSMWIGKRARRGLVRRR